MSRVVVGWVAVAVITLVAAFWAFWGGIETFYEGWYYQSLWANIGLTVVQYLSPMLISVVLAVLAIRWPRVAAVACGVLVAAVVGALLARPGQFSLVAFTALAVVLGLLGVLFWFGRPRPARWAYLVAVSLPVLVALVAATPGAIRVSQRVDDGDLGERLIEGNGVTLRWAPAGPGWPQGGPGVTWAQADSTCRRLTADGKTVASDSQRTWRLPTVDELVRSMVHHGANAGGSWDPGTASASYAVRPDKETPLWNPHSMVIYWWTATEVDADHVYRIGYDGAVVVVPKDLAPDYLGFRCVAPPR